MDWRLLIDDSVSGSYGLAADETLAKRVGEKTSLPTLRLYTYKSYSALVGRFQNIENEIDIPFCKNHNININRRPTGGGAIIMGEDQLGIALIVPGRSEDNYGKVKELMQKFSQGIINGVNKLGIASAFKGKNDIEINGKKLAGLGLYRDASGGLLFHASVLLDMDIPLMLKILKTHFEKISDKEIKKVEDRITTVISETKISYSMDELKESITKGYSNIFNIDFKEQKLTIDELNEIKNLQEKKYKSNEWIYQTNDVPDFEGQAKLKTSYGLIDVKVKMAGNTIKNIFISGDFFASENAVADLESNLRWHSSNDKLLLETISNVYSRCNGELSSLPKLELEKTIFNAINNAKNNVNLAPQADTYGCFVNPGGING